MGWGKNANFEKITKKNGFYYEENDRRDAGKKWNKKKKPDKKAKIMDNNMKPVESP